MAEQFPTFRRIPDLTKRAGKAVWRGVRPVGRGVRKSWKPVLIGILVIHALSSISGTYERRHLQRPILTLPESEHNLYTSSKNPYRHYEAAARLISDEDRDILDGDALSGKRGPQSMQSAQAGSIIKKTTSQEPDKQLIDKSLSNVQPALIELHKGFQCDGRDFSLGPHRDRAFGYNFSQYRRLARIAALDAKNKIARGKPHEGFSGFLDVIEMGNDISRGEDNSAFQGNAIKLIGYHRLYRMMGNKIISPSDYRFLASGLERSFAEREPLDRILARAYVSERESLCDLFWMGYEILHDIDVYGDDWGASIIRGWASIPGAKTLAIGHFDEAWKAMLASYKKPYPLAVKFDRDKVIPKYDTVNRIFFFNRESLLSNDAQDKALNQGIMLMAALEAYRLEHGQYPKSLSALVVGKYISRIPIDPFTDGKQFIYRHSGKKYTLYSVGTDMKDDGGEFTLLRLLDDQKGDIVFAPGMDLWAKDKRSGVRFECVELKKMLQVS